MREYWEQLYANNLITDKMGQFLERHELPKLTQGKIDELYSSISIKEIESKINNLPKWKYHPTKDLWKK